MKAIIYSAILFLTPLISLAAENQGGGLAGGEDDGGEVGSYIASIVDFINEVLFPLALAIAFIFLVWGIVRHFVIGADSDDGKTKGKQLIIYALVGFVIIFSFYGLVKLIQNGLGFNEKDLSLPVPKAPGGKN